jgi:hypothetical protein
LAIPRLDNLDLDVRLICPVILLGCDHRWFHPRGEPLEFLFRPRDIAAARGADSSGENRHGIPI